VSASWISRAMSFIWGWNPTELSFGLGADPLSNRRLPVSVRGWVPPYTPEVFFLRKRKVVARHGLG